MRLGCFSAWSRSSGLTYKADMTCAASNSAKPARFDPVSNLFLYPDVLVAWLPHDEPAIHLQIHPRWDRMKFS